MFEDVRRIDLEDGRLLIVQWQGERSGWGACVRGERRRLCSARTPMEAIAMHLGYPTGAAPEWVRALSERLKRERAEAPRYVRDSVPTASVGVEGPMRRTGPTTSASPRGGRTSPGSAPRRSDR